MTDLESSAEWDELILTEFDYGSSFTMEGSKNLQSDKLNYLGQITPLTVVCRFKTKTWNTVVFHFIVERTKQPLRDVKFAMQYIESYLKEEKISYKRIIRVRK